MNFLTAYPRKIRYQDIVICVPEPAAFALHKLIVSSKRTQKEKQQKDIETAIGILDFLFKVSQEKERVQFILAKLPSKWRATIFSVSENHFPALSEFRRK